MPETAITTTDATTLTTTDVAIEAPFINTLSADTPEGKIKTANALNSSVSLSDYMETPLQITDVIQTPGIRKARQAGQVDMPCSNTYLLDANGVSYFSQSDGVSRSIRNLLAVFPDFNKENGGLTLVCTEMELPNGNSLKQLKAVLN